MSTNIEPKEQELNHSVVRPHNNDPVKRFTRSGKGETCLQNRKVLDEKIKLKEEQEAFKVELKAMREAAQWRRLQGISMEGDDELLAATEVKEAPKRDDWMTSLPPERKVCC
ncbi:hypothetical protein Tsubulata_000054 [Turnera subulata]|uniref:Uncharacterized protein n=1 Tax=Turnera subulata TaxID=218843 RepID=A0A9Q0J903_9ROSI|nr:hypothetical protein Tsubulata_000054 [Turnera subulata]